MITKTVHAHQVLDILDQKQAPMTLEELRSVVANTFGTDAIYTNCHDDAFNFEQLLDFMTQRQKIVLRNGTVQLNKANICNHE